MRLTISARYTGPADSGNGGYVAGRVAEELLAHMGVPPVGEYSRWVEVTLRTPPPLDTPYEATLAETTLTVSAAGTVVAQARALDSPPPEPTVVAAVDTAVAREAERSYQGLSSHPFPTCWVCGPARVDGYHLQPGLVDAGRTACLWHVTSDVAGDDGDVPAHAVWAALDCPGGWAALSTGIVAVLGQISASVTTVPTAGEDCLVMGQLLGRDGRKVFTATTVYRADGSLSAQARATWITIDLP